MKIVSEMLRLINKKEELMSTPILSSWVTLSWLERIHEAGLFRDSPNQTIQWCSTNTSWVQAKATGQLWLTQKYVGPN